MTNVCNAVDLESKKSLDCRLGAFLSLHRYETSKRSLKAQK